MSGRYPPTDDPYDDDGVSLSGRRSVDERDDPQPRFIPRQQLHHRAQHHQQPSSSSHRSNRNQMDNRRDRERDRDRSPPFQPAERWQRKEREAAAARQQHQQQEQEAYSSRSRHAQQIDSRESGWRHPTSSRSTKDDVDYRRHNDVNSSYDYDYSYDRRDPHPSSSSTTWDRDRPPQRPHHHPHHPSQPSSQSQHHLQQRPGYYNQSSHSQPSSQSSSRPPFEQWFPRDSDPPPVSVSHPPADDRAWTRDDGIHPPSRSSKWANERDRDYRSHHDRSEPAPEPATNSNSDSWEPRYQRSRPPPPPPPQQPEEPRYKPGPNWKGDSGPNDNTSTDQRQQQQDRVSKSREWTSRKKGYQSNGNHYYNKKDRNTGSRSYSFSIHEDSRNGHQPRPNPSYDTSRSNSPVKERSSYKRRHSQSRSRSRSRSPDRSILSARSPSRSPSPTPHRPRRSRSRSSSPKRRRTDLSPGHQPYSQNSYQGHSRPSLEERMSAGDESHKDWKSRGRNGSFSSATQHQHQQSRHSNRENERDREADRGRSAYHQPQRHDSKSHRPQPRHHTQRTTSISRTPSRSRSRSPTRSRSRSRSRSRGRPSLDQSKRKQFNNHSNAQHQNYNRSKQKRPSNTVDLDRSSRSRSPVSSPEVKRTHRLPGASQQSYGSVPRGPALDNSYRSTFMGSGGGSGLRGAGGEKRKVRISRSRTRSLSRTPSRSPASHAGSTTARRNPGGDGSSDTGGYVAASGTLKHRLPPSGPRAIDFTVSVQSTFKSSNPNTAPNSRQATADAYSRVRQHQHANAQESSANSASSSTTTKPVVEKGVYPPPGRTAPKPSDSAPSAPTAPLTFRGSVSISKPSAKSSGGGRWQVISGPTVTNDQSGTNPSVKKFFPGDDDESGNGGDEVLQAPARASLSDAEDRGGGPGFGFLPAKGRGGHQSASTTQTSSKKVQESPGSLQSPTIGGRSAVKVVTGSSSQQEFVKPADLVPQTQTSTPSATLDQTSRQPSLVGSSSSMPAPSPIEPSPVSRKQLPPTPSARAPEELYQLVAQVGEGTFGKVYKARNVVTGSLVALKRIKVEAEKDGFPVTAMREIKLLQSMRHENVITLYEMMVAKGNVYMVFEYMEHDLTGILSQTHFSFTEAHLKSLCRQMLAGLEYLHHKGIIHRDMKGANILVNSKGELRLGDFGLARLYQKRRKNDYTNRVITLWYRPPELLLGSTVYGPEVDMWSAGTIMLELYTKKPIFQGNDEIHQLDVIYKIMGTPTPEVWPSFSDMPWYELVKPTEFHKNHFRSAFTKYLSPAALDLAEGLLAYDPAKRMTASQALKAPFFVSELPKMEQPVGLSSLEGEWHELETKREKEKSRKRRKTEMIQAQASGGEGQSAGGVDTA
ncbi:kinase subunit of RNA polymerase II carboxy-terminal domain kinase I [Tulasnella sp. 419]|nr:kinase subunit of RNA polymerase II carboxy-terminal domain kinase I [Tulasnella sp. 419]